MESALTTIKRKLSNLSSIFWILSFISLSGGILIPEKPLDSRDSSPYTYDELLDQASQKLSAFDFGRALDRLELARQKSPDPDYRYFYLLGETYFRMGKHTEGLAAFEKSLEKEPGQTPLLLRMAEFYRQDRKPEQGLLYLEKYLRFVPDDKSALYRSAILARVSGKNALAEKYFQSLESDTRYDLEKKGILEDLELRIRNRDFLNALELINKYILYFPREELLHEFRILILRNREEPELEQAIVDSAAIFFENPNFAVRYGIYLQEKERMLEALAAFRRALAISLVSDQSPKNTNEVLFLIRQTYSFLNRGHEARAMEALEKINLSKQEDKEKLLLQALRTYPKNRELLRYSVQFYLRTGSTPSPIRMPDLPRLDLEELNADEKVQVLRNRLRIRDEENFETEFVQVIGPFTREKLDELENL